MVTAAVVLASAAVWAAGQGEGRDGRDSNPPSRRAKNVILFIGDGMGVSTVTATRVYSVGVSGELVIDQFALHRTFAHVFRRLDHAGQRANDDGDDDGGQHEPGCHRV